MRHLLNAASIRAEVETSPDPNMGRLLASHVQFMNDNDYEAESLTVIIVEPGDTLEALDAELDFKLLVNHYSRTKFGDSGFVPCFETLEEHPTFYEMFFIEGDAGLAVLIPKGAGIDSKLLDLCAQHASPTEGLSS